MSGLFIWKLQNYSASLLAILTPLILIQLFLTDLTQTEHLKHLLSSTWFSLSLFAFLAISLAHAWFGLRIVIQDYVQETKRAKWLFVLNSVYMLLTVWLIWLGGHHL